MEGYKPIACAYRFSGSYGCRTVINQFEKGPSTNALVRTTLAPTIIEAGTKVNILPPSARALFNARIRPGDTVEGVVSELQGIVSDDRVQVMLLEGASEPSALSPTETPEYGVIRDQLLVVHPDAVPVPALMIARTDSRHYSSVTSSIFKITPILLDVPDSKRIHGVNKRMSLENLEKAIRFYRNVIVASSDIAT